LKELAYEDAQIVNVEGLAKEGHGSGSLGSTP
jgi:hypothetical protein